MLPPSHRNRISRDVTSNKRRFRFILAAVDHSSSSVLRLKYYQFVHSRRCSRLTLPPEVAVRLRLRRRKTYEQRYVARAAWVMQASPDFESSSN